MLFYLHVLKCCRIFVLQTNAINNMKPTLKEFAISELKNALTCSQLEQLSETLSKCASDLEVEPTIGFEHFATENDCFIFFGADDWAETIGMLSNPNHLYHYESILIYADSEVRAAFRPVYESYIKDLKKQLWEKAGSSDDFTAIWAENKLKELETAEQAAASWFFGN